MKEISTMKKIFFGILATITIVACSRNAITGRSQLKLLPESQLQSMANQQYTEFLSANKVVSTTSNKDAEMVNRVGRRISNAVTNYFASKGLSKSLEGYNWEYHLVDNKEANAWCMPGGKIVVYTGLLPYTQNEAALAVVLGHEVSHAVLQHGNERMSQMLGAELVGAGLQVAMSEKPQETQNAFYTAFGLGSQVGVLLPYARKHEYEADHYGLIWAAMAGYNPKEAIPLWERMEAASQNNLRPPEFLSDHPVETSRIKKIKEWMPEALGYYKPMGK